MLQHRCSPYHGSLLNHPSLLNHAKYVLTAAAIIINRLLKLLITVRFIGYLYSSQQ